MARLLQNASFAAAAAVVSTVFAQTSQPASGPWKGRPVGSFVVMQVTAIPPATQPTSLPANPKTTFQRTLLVGSENGLARFSVARASAATGPWTETYGHGDSKIDDDRVVTTPLGRQKLDVAGRSIDCDGVRTETTSDRSVSTSETWADANTGVVMKFVLATRGRDDGPPPQVVAESVAVGFETVVVAGASIEGVRETGFALPGRRGVNESLVSDRVPGHRLAFRRWTGADSSGPPAYEERLVAFGVDAAAAAASTFKPTPPPSDDQFKRDFLDTALSEAADPDPAKRAHGLATLGMNRWPADRMPAIEAAIRPGLADADPAVRRAAASAAGWNRLPNAARDILAALTTDSGGRAEYVKALGDAADPIGLSAVVAAVSEKGPVGWAAIRAMVKFDTPEADRAMDAIAGGSDVNLRRTLISELARGASRHGLDLLIAATRDAKPGVRQAALISLAERADPAGLGAAIAAIGDTGEDVRRTACIAVTSIAMKGRCTAAERKTAVDALAGLIDRPPGGPLRSVAATGLAALGDDRALPTLRNMVADPAAFQDRYAFLPADQTALLLLSRMDTPAASAELLRIGHEPGRTEAVLNAMLQARSPASARTAWVWYREFVIADGPATRRAASTVASVADRLLQIVGSGADTSLRDEVEASITSAPAAGRPGLRQTVREIGRRRTKDGPPPSTRPGR